jgi:hypothetical protein
MTLPNRQAWLLSLIVWITVGAIAWATGSIQYTVKHWRDASHPKPPTFITALSFGLVYTFIVFFAIFPKITTPKGRPYSITATLLMGVPMGINDAMLRVILLGVARSLSDSWTVGIVFIMDLILSGMFYAIVFDGYIAPSHNIPKWDAFKISANAFLTLMLAYFVVSFPDDLWMNFVLNGASMLGSVSSMHFLLPWNEYPPESVAAKTKDRYYETTIQVAVI